MKTASLPNDDLLAVLQEGKISLEGQFYNSSNYTFLVTIREGEHEVLAVYKPAQGERPLWDFPEGTLVNREMAAYVVSEGLGWDFVPLTILREDAPYGPGSLQAFIPHDPDICRVHQGDPVNPEGVGVDLGFQRAYGQRPEARIVFHKNFGGAPAFHPAPAHAYGIRIRSKDPEAYAQVLMNLRGYNLVSHPWHFLGTQVGHTAKHSKEDQNT